jgi:hypothetical protein
MGPMAGIIQMKARLQKSADEGHYFSMPQSQGIA